MMKAFFLHKKFWMPFLVLFFLLLLVEMLLRWGVYDGLVEPRSFLGNGINRVSAVEALGKENIHWVTLGDSRIDWGVDHNEIRMKQAERGKEHVRMSFESSNFMTIQATLAWSIENMSQLEGVMIGISENGFAHKANVKKLFKVVWPFRSALDFDGYQMMAAEDEWKLVTNRLATVNYFADIKDLVNRPLKRLKRIRNDQMNSDGVWAFKKSFTFDVCQFPLSTLNDCVDTAKTVKNIPQNRGFRLPKELCSSANVINRARVNLPMLDSPVSSELQKNWVALFEYALEKGVKIKLVLLPEHEMHNYLIKPRNASEIVANILSQLENEPNFELIDLRNIIPDQGHCSFFADPLHFNNKGIDLVTEHVLRAL